MRTFFFLTVLFASRISFSQKTFHLPATFRDSNYLRIGVAESMSKITSDSDYIFSASDSNCSIRTYYYNVSFTSGKTASGQINVLFCKKENGYGVTVDQNNNKNFNDDSTAIVFADHIHNKYLFTINPAPSKDDQQKHVLYLGISLITIQTTESNGSFHSNVFLQLVHRNSICASFTLGKYLYNVEAIPKYLNNGTGEASIGFSEPNKEIEKMNVAQNIIPHRLRNDTIISGTYKFIIDSVDFINNIISLTAWPMTDKDYGYKISNRIRNYSLSYLNDTTKKTSLKPLFKTSNYMLIDFWGSWCEPCIRNIPKLKKLNKESARLSLKIIGIACERANNPSSAINILQKYEVTYNSFFINSNLKDDQKIIDDLDVFAFPTYILLNKNLKIVMRETNENGLDKISNFLRSVNR